MDLYLVQLLQNKVLNGVELSETEKAILKKYEQSQNDVFANWLANNYQPKSKKDVASNNVFLFPFI